ncbi:proline dehydrogenase [Paenibacillus sp. HJL G12]|uniref:proline dehydrogenase n=1 Tax=Paenibacillus dendrobii TaxID=2691084 RepID=A0A7X3IET0_9BACL|nr:proline dehydrogenase family protein [Paenibacillus dendrobii]MWV42161.1 proline dehydrogenase [Paenibacillus dendrobii]
MDSTELYRKVLLSISGNRLVEKLSLKYGKKLAGKFIAGDTLAEALAEIEVLNGKGILVTLDHLGEGIKQLSEATGYKEEYIRLMDGIAERNVRSNVSLKPTQMGLALDPAACYSNIRAVVSQAKKHGNFVRIDMEDTPFTQATIEIVLKLHEEGLTNVGTVIQAYLFRTEEDVKRLMEAKVNLRLVKGAYKESGTVAYQQVSEVIDNYKKIIRMHLDSGVYTAIASHDDRVIHWVKDYAAKNGIGKDAFEFQMLYGLRMTDQEKLAKEGYNIRCYMPYGTMWYPYYTRRLAEKPANLWMVVKNMFK